MQHTPIHEIAAAYGAQLLSPYANRVLETLGKVQEPPSEDLDYAIMIAMNVARADLTRDEYDRPFSIEARRDAFVVAVGLVEAGMGALTEPYTIWIYSTADGNQSLIPRRAITGPALRFLMQGFIAGLAATK